MSKPKPNVIKPTPLTKGVDGMVDDTSLQNAITRHVKAFGFEHVIDNVIEAYRVQARRFNKKAEELDKKFKR